MAIGNLQRILKERGMNLQPPAESADKVSSDEGLSLMLEYMEKSFKTITEFLAIINKNQLLLLKKIEELNKE